MEYERGYASRPHMGHSDPRDNRSRRERMDGFLSGYGTPDDFTQERHNDVSPPRDTYEGRPGHGRVYRTAEYARPRAHPNDRQCNRTQQEDSITWTNGGETSGISMRAARQYHVDSIDGEDTTRPRVVKVSRKSLHEESLNPPINRNIFETDPSDRVEEIQDSPLWGLGLLTQVAHAGFNSDIDEVPGTELN